MAPLLRGEGRELLRPPLTRGAVPAGVDAVAPLPRDELPQPLDELPPPRRLRAGRVQLELLGTCVEIKSYGAFGVASMAWGA